MPTPLPRHLHALSKSVLGCLLAALLLYCSQTQARVGIDGTIFQQNLNWNGFDLQSDTPFCVTSTQEPSPHGSTLIPYRVRLLTALTLSNGNQQISADASWHDLINNNQHTLSAGIFSSETLSGAVTDCPGGNNAQLRLLFTETELTTLGPGFYTGEVTIEVANSGGGRTAHTFSLTVNLHIQDTMRVSQLTDFQLGQFSGMDIQSQQSLCVFRGSGGNYGVTLTGSGDGGSFVLRQGDSEIPYSVNWNDGNGSSSAAPGAILNNQANSFTGNDHCNNGASNNAQLGIFVSADDVNQFATESGTHLGTLTIMVEMQ